jgi:hypothetical protein
MMKRITYFGEESGCRMTLSTVRARLCFLLAVTIWLGCSSDSSNSFNIDVGEFSSCAVVGDVDLRCWGFNMYGQLGNGTKESNGTPPQPDEQETGDFPMQSPEFSDIR